MERMDRLQLKGIGARNYRSFGSEGFIASPLSKINVFIGKNNCGKSNVLSAIDVLAKSQDSKRNLSPTDKCRNGNGSISVALAVECMVPRSGQPDVCQSLTLWFDLDQRSWSVEPSPTSLESAGLLRRLHDVLSSTQWAGAPSRDAVANSLMDALREWGRTTIQNRFVDLVYIPAIREVHAEREGSREGDNFDPSGRNIIRHLRSMQHPLIGRESEQETFKKIESFVANLLHVESITLEIPALEDDIYVTLYGNRLPLRSYGTGLHELVLLCSTLAIFKNRWVCIEEPEIHLHPELVRRFVRFLHDTDNTYFITTHSNVLLDAESEASIFHVRHDGKESRLTSATTLQHNRQVVQDLAYRASDLVQANGIIWVEGPSDRIFLNRWLELVGCKAVEGIHYSVLFYGGAVLDHHTFTQDDPPFSEDFINVLKVNANAMVIIDSDIKPGIEKLREYKERVASEIGEDRCWITKGKEIENYLRAELINSVWGKRFNKVVNVSFGKDDVLQDCLQAAAGKSVRYNKVRDSRLIADAMTVEDLEVLDLKSWLGKTMKAIAEWNR